IRLETIGEDFFRDLGLRQTPTLGVFKNGLEVSRLLGFQSLAQIEAAVQTYL
ncbi:MAG TPA: thioredoxin family protein, partial [Xylella fastidiosa subsp. pauca]